MTIAEIAHEAFYWTYLIGMAVVVAAEFYTITRTWRRADEPV